MRSITARNFGPAESSHEQALTLPPPEKLLIVAGFEDLVYDPRPLLVVPDSRGQLATRFMPWRSRDNAPHWCW